MRVLVDGSRLSDDMTFFFLSFFLSLISSTQSLFWSRKKIYISYHYLFMSILGLTPLIDIFFSLDFF
jgi:hypothetical protein